MSDPEPLGLLDALRTTGAVREFQDRPVPHEVLARVLDTARFAPNGGNQQAWHVILVEDPATRATLRDLYVEGWLEYLAMRQDGIQPWAPVGDRGAEAAAIARSHVHDATSTIEPGDFAAHLDRVPVLAVVAADLRKLAGTDRDLGRYTLVGGASVYPFVWNLLLAGRAEGLGGVITTVNVVREPALKELLGIPEHHAVCAVLTLGYPVRQVRRLTRGPVESFTTIDRFDGEPLPSPPAG